MNPNSGKQVSLFKLEASGVVRSGCLEVAEAPAPQFNESPVASMKWLFLSWWLVGWFFY